MLPLVVTVEQVAGGVRRYAFADSPVSVGRSPFAELQLSEPFISRWEGTLRFDEHAITYFSLGATNSTFVDGRAVLAREEDLPLQETSVLTLGELTLRFSREPVPEADLRRKGKRRPTRSAGGMAVKTVYLDAWSAPEPAPVPQLLAAESTAPVKHTAQFDAAKQAYLAAHAAWSSELRAALAKLPEGEHAEFLRLLREQQPALLCDTERPPERASGDIPELRAWLQAIGRDVLPELAELDSGAMLTRVLGLLEALTQSLAEIHDAQESVRKRWLGRSARRSILQSDKGHVVLAYLLNPRADWDERLRELEQSVRDVVTHELALFKATLEGARTLLETVSPEAVEHAEAHAEPLPEPPFWQRWLGGHAPELRLWHRLKTMHGELKEDARYERIFLGRGFARSYLAAMGQARTGAAE